MTTPPTALPTSPSPRTRRIARGIHVIPARDGGWEVRTLGSRRVQRRFESKLDALSCALRLQEELGSEVDVIVHQSGPGHPTGQGYRRVTLLPREEAPEDLPDPS